MKDDIRRATGLIIRKENEFLVGTILWSTDLRWSLSPWDAWRTRDPGAARQVAEKVGGEIELFNPVTAQRRAYRP